MERQRALKTNIHLVPWVRRHYLVHRGMCADGSRLCGILLNVELPSINVRREMPLLDCLQKRERKSTDTPPCMHANNADR